MELISMNSLFWSSAVVCLLTSSNALAVNQDASNYTSIAVCYNAEHQNLEVLENATDCTGKYESTAAFGIFRNEINGTGWSFLEIVATANISNKLKAYAAGVAEGMLTRDLIRDHWNNTVANYCNGTEEYCEKLQRFLKLNLEWMQRMITKYPKDPYWEQVELLLLQLAGLEDGYHDHISQPHLNIAPFKFLFLQLTGDLMDLEPALGKPLAMQRRLAGEMCSAFLKPTVSNQDFLFSHVTWLYYRYMLRIQKLYRLEYSNGKNKIACPTMAFSSYPGYLFSLDDFYLLSTGLAVTETTLNNYNETSMALIKPNAVLTWIRTQVANRLAYHGASWISIHVKFHSGTYNNQWMIVDYNKFKAGQKLQVGLFYALELMPNTTQFDGLTNVLEQQGYWASYNRPYFSQIANVSNISAMADAYGDYFTHDQTPRALIFKRDWHNVTDLASLTELMRYNNFRKDPLSACNCTPPYTADFAISARNDLNDLNGQYPVKQWGWNPLGGTDLKATNVTLAKLLQFVAVSGPTYDDVEPFVWSKSGFTDVPHFGHPDKFAFKPVVHKWVHYP